MMQRQAVVKKRALTYKRSPRAVKTRILDELLGLTGWHRDYPRAALRYALNPPPPKPRTGRSPLAPMTATPVLLLRQDKCAWSTMLPHGCTHTKPGSLLKSQIPMRTWAEWDDAVPGFVEIDLVAHEGGNSSGDLCFTMTVTDISTGWTVNRAARNKAAKWVFEALQYVMVVFPFPIKEIDTDNCSWFINDHSFDYCKDHKITFTRSRPYNKNDGAHVEQKNWARVRELVGY